MLEAEEKDQVKVSFTGWMEIQERRKELSKEVKELIDDTSRLLNVKKTLVSQFFRMWQKKHEEGQDDLEDLIQISTELEAD